MLLAGCPAGVDRLDRDQFQAEQQDQQDRDGTPPAPRLAAAGAAAGLQEVSFDLAQGIVPPVGADPGGGLLRGGQAAAAVQVGRVAGGVDPLLGGAGQASPDSAVGAGFGQPDVAEQRPGGEQSLVANLDRVGGQGKEPLGGERLQDHFHVRRLSLVPPCGQVGAGDPGGRVHAVAGHGGQAEEHLAGDVLLRGGEPVVGALRADGDGTLDAAGPLVVGQRQILAGSAAPGLVERV